MGITTDIMGVTSRVGELAPLDKQEMNAMTARELRTALFAVWIAVSVAILLVLAAPFALGAERVARWSPQCEWKRNYGRACFVCGMTTSFLAISRGSWAEARQAHRAGIPLYLAFLGNELLLSAVLTKGVLCRS
jgi:hypothetical protein